jgi:hypothetical protein
LKIQEVEQEGGVLSQKEIINWFIEHNINNILSLVDAQEIEKKVSSVIQHLIAKENVLVSYLS